MPTNDARFQRAQELLKQYYGYDAFRPGQRDIIRSILQGQDTVGIMPTGGGKSICYQIPALIYERLTLVVSPLISLMKDQVDALTSAGISATYINSTLSLAEVQDRMRRAEQGEYRLLYVSPERLEAERFLSWLNRLKPEHVAIDEAHCLSQWGHDFRPSYRAMAALLQTFDHRPIITALTATATPEVIEDVVQALDLRDPNVFVTGFDRANLTFSVVTGQDKRDFVLQYLASRPNQAGIIYAATRKEVESLCEYLRKKRYAAGRYHGGLGDAERTENQEQFLYDETRIMVATNAFGMGIDKSNVRFVIHYNMPKNLESYYQEAGRAGRDGGKADCVLLFSPQDVQTQKFLIEQATENRKALEYRKLQTMVDYCHTTQCLRSHILHYFGEDAPDRCDNCSNCNQGFELQDITIRAQQIFSCVVRVKERFGVKVIAGVLKGSKDKRILELGLHQLPTYGLMKNRPEKDIVGLVHSLIADGYLKLSDGKYPVVQLLPNAVPILKQQSRVMMRIQQERVVEQVSNVLFDKLRAWRREVSQREKVPPYVIFSDNTLHELAAVCPEDRQSMLAVKGIGEMKFEKFGQALLEVCRTHASETRSSDLAFSHPGKAVEDSDGPGRATMPRDDESEHVASHLVTYGMYQNGMEVSDIMVARNLSQTTVEKHLIRSAEEGHPLDWDAIIPDGHEGLILAATQTHGATTLRVLKEVLPEEISYFTIRAVLCKILIE